MGVHFEQNVSEKGVLRATTFLFGKCFLNVPGAKKTARQMIVAESKIFPHNFRHLFARIYYKVTKDITGLADLLGHSSINVTRIYTATTETVFQKKLDKIVEQEILECTT